MLFTRTWVVENYVEGNEKHQIPREFPLGRKAEMSYLKLGNVNTGVDCNPVYTFYA